MSAKSGTAAVFSLGSEGRSAAAPPSHIREALPPKAVQPTSPSCRCCRRQRALERRGRSLVV